MKFKLSYVLAFVMLMFHAGWMLFTFLAMHVNGGEVLLHEYTVAVRYIEMMFAAAVLLLGWYCLCHHFKYGRR